VRDQHIAAALGELTVPAQSNGRLRFLSVAAAVVVLLAGGIAFSRNSDDTPPALAADTTVVSLPKTASDPSCAEEFSGLWEDSGSLGSFALSGVNYEMIQRKGVLSLYLSEEPCTKIGEIQYEEAMEVRDKVDDSPQVGAECDWSNAPLARFSDRANREPYSLVLAKTDSGVSLFFMNRCTETLGSIALPALGD